MEIKELQEGEIYYCHWHHNPKNPFYFQAENMKDNYGNCRAIRIEDRKVGNDFVLSRKNEFNCLGSLRIANYAEKQWFNKCFELNKFFPKPIEELELLNFVEIY